MCTVNKFNIKIQAKKIYENISRIQLFILTKNVDIS